MRLYKGRETKEYIENLKKCRDDDIRVQYSHGYTIRELARIYQLSNACIHQILHMQ